ncbi:MAG: hypothetical protein RLY50_793 [Actinomycetota bacterium]
MSNHTDATNLDTSPTETNVTQNRNIDLSRYSGKARRPADNSSAAVTRRPASQKKGKPAASAKILATGLSATAMLGMTAGYSLAARESTPTPRMTPEQGLPMVSGDMASGNVAQTPDATVGAAQPQLLAPLVAPTAPAQSAPVVSATAPVAVAPVAPQSPVQTAAPQPQVVEIPVETVAPAKPGNGGGGWNNQSSSGSN